MTKYKVGDKVVITDGKKTVLDKSYDGKIFTVLRISENYDKPCVWVKADVEHVDEYYLFLDCIRPATKLELIL